jgi:unsaturated rhamnogalacturonyl hydrolase
MQTGHHRGRSSHVARCLSLPALGFLTAFAACSSETPAPMTREDASAGAHADAPPPTEVPDAGGAPQVDDEGGTAPKPDVTPAPVDRADAQVEAARTGAADSSASAIDAAERDARGDVGSELRSDGATALEAGTPAFDRAAIKALMLRAARYQLTLYNNTALNDWIDSTFYVGLMATYRTTAEADLLAAARSWGQRRSWDVYQGTTNPRFADNQTCTQAYLELYELDPTPANDVMITRARTVFDSMVAAPVAGRVEWYWCDALFMAPPALARMGTILRQPKYIDLMHQMFVDTKTFLFSPTYNLFYRDVKYLNGDTFWSRGNGWVVAGSARILDYLAESDARRAFYIDLLKAMSGALVRAQGADGLWRTNLLHPDAANLTNPETSGTGFFTYAMAWGINHGALPRDIYLPVVTKAWNGLVQNVNAQGRLGYVQTVGEAPTAAAPDETHPYGVGALLLAGSEVVKL